MKYIIYRNNNNGYDEFVLFPDVTEHRKMADRLINR